MPNRIDAVIYSVRRAPSSRLGNPSFYLTTSAGEYRTGTDSAIGYAIENYTNPRFTDTYVIGNPNFPVVTLVTARNRVIAIEYNGATLH